MTTPGFHNDLIRAVLQPLFVLNPLFELLHQSDQAAALSNNNQYGIFIGNVLHLKRKETDSTALPLIEALNQSLRSKQKIVLNDRLILFEISGASSGIKGDIEILPFADKEGNITQLLLQIIDRCEPGTFLDPAKEQEYQQELLLKQANEDTLINSTDDLVWSVDTSFCIISSNTAFANMIEQMTGVKLQRGNSALNTNYPTEQLAKWKTYYERAFAGEKFSIKEETLNDDGELIHCSFISITPLLDYTGNTWGAACFGKDITAETKASRTLAKVNFELQNILASSVDIICTFNANGEFQNINNASINIWGYTPEELIHTHYKTLLHPDDLHKSDDAAREVLKGKDITDFENRYIKKNGDVVPMIWSARWDSKSGLMYCVGKDATEKNKAEKSLKESEKRFRLLVENSDGAIGIIHPDGTAMYASPSIRYVIGYTEQESLTLNMFDLIHPDDKDKVAEKLGESLRNAGEPVANTICRVRHKDGNWRWIAAVFTNLINELYIGGIVINFRDITERVNHELQLELLIDNTEEGFILMDKKLNIVSFNRQFEKLYRKYFRITVEKGINILHYAQPERKPLVQKIYERVFAGAHETSEIEVPDPDGGTRIFRLAYKPAINQLGEVEGAFVSTTDITITKRNEQQTKEHQSFIETAIENLPIGIAVNRTEDNVNVLMNKNFADIYGWPKDELINVSSIFEKVYPNEQYRKEIATRILEDVKSGESSRMAWDGVNITTKTGEKRIVNIKNIPVFDQNLMISTVIDVTERETNLKRIKDSERKLLAAQRLVKLGNWQLDFETGDFDWSDEVYNIWGLSKGNFKPDIDTFYATIHPDDRALFDIEREAVITRKKQLDIEHRIVLPDGSVKWVHEKGTVVLDEEGNNKMVEGSVQDITVEKLLSISLEESNHRYHYATQATSDAIWDWDIVKDTMYRGENYQFIFGYSEEDLIASSKSWLNHIHIDDRANVISSVQAALDGNQSKWSGEYKYEQRDGTYAYVTDRGIIVRDRNGKPIRMVGAMQDITKQKEEESRLKLLESVITNTNDAVLITEAEPMAAPGPRIIYVNEAFTRMTGYTLEEVIGKSPRILQGPLSDLEELRKMGEAMKRWEPCEITIINYKKNGEPFWINFAVTPVADASGWFTHWVAVERDVTKLKLAEQDLQTAYDERLTHIRNIEEKNKQLSEIAWIQSHIVRAPLARIMGIVDVLSQFDLDADESKQFLLDLTESAEALDKIIREIAEKSDDTRL
ncbi:MAG: PAS domain S-box protein [Bacteroidota bacterium]